MIPTYEESYGPQCCYCGKEDYTMRYHCSICDDLLCSKCLDKHSDRHTKFSEE